MTTLHTLSQPCSNPEALQQQLRYRQPSDPVLLLQDAVLMAQQPRFTAQLTQYPLYVLQDDVAARGLSLPPQLTATLISYPEFVQLTLDTQQQVSW
ncbi:sulfurtransferase complex subunit TusB [uncultured Ferrimonas sp.]|uniref:sulfurtransferase complex subunit TusB n=1 Tax=uncultured Ferrimonas sp. TaxID=432640 RepID=UPI00262644A2|nr:sulfurtransferase complex subunit TusB [uncultured Ferrimonas sp.]